MEKTAIVKIELSGCMYFRRLFIEVMDTGCRVNDEVAAEERYATMFGAFVSHYCDQCYDYTQLTSELLSEKQRRRLLFKHLSATMDADEELYRLPALS